MKPSPIFQTLFIALFYILAIPGTLTSQCIPVINHSSGSCETAVVSCLPGACYLTSQNFGGEPYIGWCGPNTAVHNPQYFAFIASGEFVQINILVVDCPYGQGLQSAILGTCPWTIDDVLACNPGMNEGGTMELQVNDATPGQTYYLIVDGSAGSLCHYEITYTEGVTLPPPIQPLENTDLTLTPSYLCPDDTTVVLSIDTDTSLLQGYTITYEWNNETLVATSATSSLYIAPDVPSGTWDICIRTYSGCDTTEYVICREIIIAEDLPEVTITGDSTLCADIDDVEYAWHSCFDQVLLSTDQCFTPTTPACYCVDVTHDLGCITSTCYDMLVGMDNPDQQISLTVSRTDVVNEYHVEVGDPASIPITWILVDHAGRTCGKGNIENTTTDIQFQQDLSTGLYFLQFQNQRNGFAVRKIILQ